MPQGQMAILEVVRRALNGTELRWPNPSLVANSDGRTWADLTAEHRNGSFPDPNNPGYQYGDNYIELTVVQHTAEGADPLPAERWRLRLQFLDYQGQPDHSVEINPGLEAEQRPDDPTFNVRDALQSLVDSLREQSRHQGLASFCPSYPALRSAYQFARQALGLPSEATDDQEPQKVKEADDGRDKV